jgi:anthranilate phosphoribosyltransferase
LGGDAVENAATTRGVFGENIEFKGDRNAIQDIVALNASAGMTAYELNKTSNNSEFDLLGSLKNHYLQAQEAINDGTALAKLNQWVDLSKSAGE